MTTPIRVLVADDHFLVREGIAALLGRTSGIDIVGEASNGVEAVALYARLRPDIVLLDLQMPSLDGHAALRTVMRLDAGARVIVLSMYQGDVHIRRALAAGARAYVFKSAMRFDLAQAIRLVARGDSWFPADVATALSQQYSADALSAREAQILQLIAGGNSNREVGAAIAIAEETVKAHVSTIMAKLKAKDRTHAVAIAIQRGILEI